MNNEIILATQDHPLYSKLKALSLPLFSRSEVLSQRPQIVWDFTLGATEEKRTLFQELRSLGVKTIHADLTTSFGDKLIKEFEEIESAFALACWSPNDQYELWQRDPEADFGLLQHLPLEPVEVQSAGLCFIYPRVIATLINESRFTVKDRLADNKDLDRAMKFGVNYPLGLIEWEQKIGQEIITLILKELHESTRSERYKSIN